MSNSETNSLVFSDYINASNYHSSGIQRVARFAPQVEHSAKQTSSIPRPVLFRPPQSSTVASYYPTYDVIGDSDSNYCKMDDVIQNRCK